MVAGGYPGTGVRRVVVDKGVSYGVHGDKDLAELVRARGWLSKPPAFDPYLRLVDAALFEGLSQADDHESHDVHVDAGVLELMFWRRTFPSNALEKVTVRIGRTGNALIQTGGPAPASGSKEAPDPLGGRERALASGNAVELSEAIRRLSGRHDPHTLKILARATLSATESVQADALDTMGKSPESAKALKAALKGVSAERREVVIRLAAEINGAEFAGKLK
jgi:hypothetical protein